MIKLIACDLDGTLLLNKAESTSSRIHEQIKILKEKGILFAAASGRQYYNLRRLFAPEADDIGYICENGSLVMYRDQIVHSSTIDTATVEEAIQLIRETDKCEALYSGAFTCYIEPKTSAYAYRVYYITRNKALVVPDLDQVKDPCIKISLYEPGGYTPEVEDLFNAHFGKKLHVVTAGNSWLDMMPLNSGKGIGIEMLSKGTGIPLENIMAIGDNLNDNAMLERVGYPVAMRSGHPDTKALCPVHIDKVEDYLDELIKEI